MSGYFARLAQRSGALPFAPRPSSSVQAAAGIVEQENVVEVPASSPVGVDVPARVPTPPSERTANASIPSPAQSTPAAADTASSAPSVMRADAPARKSTSPRMPRAGHGEPMTVPAPPTLNASSVHEASTGAAYVAAPSSGPTQSAEHGAHENGAWTPAPRLGVIDDSREVVRPSAVAPRSEGRIRHGEGALSHPPLVSHEVTSAHPSAQPGSETREHRWSGVAEKTPSKVERVETRAQAAAGRTTMESSRTAPAQNIDVHIGAVRLEIHGQLGPTSTPAAASAPARTTEERPRFAPRRYYLRG